MGVRRIGLLVLLSALTFSSACDRCAFRLINQDTVTGELACCGAWARHDVQIASGTNRKIDLSNTGFANAGRVDLWLTSTDCEQLFDGDYPGGTKRCTTLVGPIAPGQVSDRVEASGGRYRVFVQSYSTNTAPARYVGDVGTWGNDCTGGGPTLR